MTATTTTAEQVQTFAGAIFEPDDLVELRLLPSGEQRYIRAAELSTMLPWLEARNAAGQNIYLGVNPRKREGGTAEDVALAKCLFVDFDGIDANEAMRRIDEAGLPWPTVIVLSGHGVHFYWRLEVPLTDLGEWTRRQKTLIAQVGSDEAIHDPPRIMRLPGLLNVKAEPFVPCELVEAGRERVYSLDEFPDPPPGRRVSVPDNGQAKRPPAGRNNTLASLAGTMRRRAFSYEATRVALHEENQRRFEDPLPASEVDGIVRSIGRYDPAAESDVAQLKATDMGNAERFAIRHGAEVRYTKGHGWLTWGSGCWQKDDIGEVQRRGKATVRAIYGEADEAEDTARRKQLSDLAKKSEAINRVKAMIELAQSEPGIALRSADLDRDPWLFNCANGTIDLRTGELRPHDPADHITKISPVVYDPGARSELWERFLDETTGGDDEVAEFLQRAVGYSLTGDTSEEKLFFVSGPEATGKSTFIEAIKATLGDYSTTADFATFLTQRHDGPRNDIARLAGARLVVSIEVEEGRKLAEGLVKSLTGGDTIAARFLYRESFEYLPAFKLWLVANHAPSVNADDGAIWRRIVRIPFERMVPIGRRDPTVKLRLRDPAESGPAILAWAVKGCLDWRQNGLEIPESVAQATMDYRTAEDILGQFIADRCVTAPGISVGATQLYRGYKGWCDEAGEKTMTQTAFGRRLDERGFSTARLGSGQKCRRGIGLLHASGGQE